MKIDSNKFGLATLLVFAVFWVICSAFVAAMPMPMMQMSGHMVHADFGQMAWQLNWGGFFYGLIAWSVIAGVAAWAIASVYNWLLD